MAREKMTYGDTTNKDGAPASKVSVHQIYKYKYSPLPTY